MPNALGGSLDIVGNACRSICEAIPLTAKVKATEVFVGLNGTNY